VQQGNAKGGQDANNYNKATRLSASATQCKKRDKAVRANAKYNNQI
jgi:hypothetical protein